MLGNLGNPHEREERRSPLPVLSGWCFVACATIAVGYGLWALYGSGESVATFDVRPDAATAPAAPVCLTYGPVALDPSLNPFRAVLRTGYAPLGSERLGYEVAMKDAAGVTRWDERGSLGSRDDEASFVRATASLLEFEIERAGTYTFEVQFPGGSMDDLREATLELRGGIVRVDPRITWGFGLAAFGCLVVTLVTSRRERHPYAPPGDELRDAA